MEINQSAGFVRKQQQRARVREILTDILVILICLSGAGAAFVFFWIDINKSLTKLNESPIANVHFKKNNVQRRFGDRVVWDVLQQESPVYNADVIHTSNLSETEVSYFDGFGNKSSGLYLDQNSLIQVFSDRIELANGKIDIRTSSSGMQLKLVSSGTVIDIGENSLVVANSTNIGGGNVQVLEGTAKITTTEGTQEAAAGEALAVRADGHRDTSPQVVLLTPKPNQTLVSNSTVRFSWHTNNFGAGDFVRFEISTNQRFSEIIKTADVRNTAEQTVDLSSGVYWWRAYPVNTGGQTSGAPAISNKITLVELSVPHIISPVENAVIHYASEAPAVKLQWTSSGAQGIGFFVEISNNSEMRNSFFRQEVFDQNFINATGLSAGRYYWNVRPVLQDVPSAGSQLLSRTASFTLEHSSSVMAAPVLLAPADRAAITLSNGVTLSWNSNEAAASYTVQAAAGSEFSEPVLNRKIGTNFLIFNAANSHGLTNGVWYWRVAAADAAGNTSAWSSARTFILSTSPPPVEPLLPTDGWAVSESLYYKTYFRWKENVDGAARLQISANESFSQLLADTPVYGGETSAPALGVGTYFWRVFWTGAAGSNYTSAPRRFTIDTSKKIALEFPANNAEISGASLIQDNVELRWSTTESISKSRLFLSTSAAPDSAQNKPLLDITDPPRNVRLPALGEGVYYWIVHGETQNGVDISAPSANRFRVSAAPLISAVTLTAPQNNAILDARFLRENRGIAFSWSASPKANAYVVSIYRINNRNTPVFQSQPLRQTSLNFTRLNTLDPGDFIWQVEPVFVSESNLIEQHGIPRTAGFRIEITLPQNKTSPNEESYGF
ncbi:MAG: hypothetical protein Pg6A_05440 [Termitinemataceae bacterium]|nr:MAG: hypothetical protein Pg6A_05440 [Termitinemataceae bacterium]